MMGHYSPSLSLLCRKAVGCTVAFLFFIGCLALSPKIVHGDAGDTTQFKGLWVVRHHLSSRESIDTLVDFATNHGFQQLLVQIRGRGYAYYRSEIVPRAPGIRERDWDPLQYLLEQARTADLEVHAWMNMYLVWSAPKRPEHATHILNSQPEWIDQDFAGEFSLKRYFNESTEYSSQFIFLAPTHPEVNPYLAEVVREVATNYNITGIHLDYIRSHNLTYGYNTRGRMLFQEEYGIDPLELTIAPDTVGQAKRVLWDSYRRQKVTDLVSRVKSACDSNGMQLSAAVKPNPTDASQLYFQEWDHWVQTGLIDFVVPMNYTRSNAEFLANLKRIDGSVSSDKVVVGIGAYKQSRFETAEKLIKIRHSDYRGYCLFSYESFLRNPEYIRVVDQFIRLD